MPKHGACWIFTNAKTGATQYASVEGSTATHWLLILARTDDLHKITRLSRAHWQPTWHVRWTCFCRNTTAYYDAVALGDLARAEKIDRAMRDKTQMPKLLPADAVIPDLVELAEASAGSRVARPTTRLGAAVERPPLPFGRSGTLGGFRG